MSNSVRENILSRINTDLAYLTAGNGYEHTLVNYYSGIVKTGQPPYLCYWIWDDDNKKQNENKSVCTYELHLIIVLFFEIAQSNANVGQLSTEGEKWVKDLRAWVYQKQSLTAGKYLNLQLVEGVQSWHEQKTTNVYDFDSSKAEIQMFLNITYTDNFNE